MVKLTDNRIPFIKYNVGYHYLRLQLSIPKFLFGNNITLIKATDIDAFFTELQQEISHLLGIKIEDSQWKVQRLDLSWNFNVGNKVQDYIKQISNQRASRMNTITLFDNAD
ncbi:hypothetical protein SAMN02799630_03605 [Paenibacillus sp. UNCCL117]|nr:hypothetical protein SAMN04488602_10814 [Paenibacillus sp. cl123]SFW48749.1 hypothetical protein SAMN02799630_03605 [Paenibacillus sp. UNCCL117]